MFVQTQNCRELRVVLRKPSLKKKELRGEMVWSRSSQSSPEPFVLSFYMLDQSMFVQRVGERSRMCICLTWEISSTLIVAPTFYLTKKNKKETDKSSTSWNTGESYFHYNYYYFYFCYLLLLLLFLKFILCVHPTFYPLV
jgi:hypothetical protein